MQEMMDHLEQSAKLKGEADQLLEQSGLLVLLAEYGNVHFTGSYFYDVLTWRDIDLCLAVDVLSHDLVLDIAKRVAAVPHVGSMYYRNELIMQTQGNPHAIFLCIDFYLSGDARWKVDILVAQDAEVQRVLESGRAMSERLTPGIREAIVRIKADICQRPGYRREFSSRTVYEAVLDHGVRTVDEWDAWYRNRKAQQRDAPDRCVAAAEDVRHAAPSGGLVVGRRMTALVDTHFVVKDPEGTPLLVSLNISPPRREDDGQWVVEVVCPAVPHATASFAREDPLTCVCFALSLVHRFMLDEFSKGYSVEGWSHVGDFIDDLFCAQASGARRRTGSRSRPVDYDALLKAIEDLMRRLPDVDKVHAWHAEGQNSVQFRCRSMEALACVDDIATGANLVVRVWPFYTCSQDPDAIPGRDGLHFCIEIPDDGTDEATDVEIFGFYLISDLVNRGNLSPEEQADFEHLFGGE